MKKVIKSLDFLFVCLATWTCNVENKGAEMTSFRVQVETIKKNGYAVDFTENESDVFDLAVLKILIPEGYSGSYMQMVLDDEERGKVFTEGASISFDMKAQAANEFFQKLESKSTLNLVYTSLLPGNPIAIKEDQSNQSKP